MTDEQIIKAMAACVNNTTTCAGCPYEDVMDGPDCVTEIMKHAVELINRQQTMIDALNHTNKTLMETEEVVKANVRKFTIIEFSDKLKEHLRFEDDCEYDCENCCYACRDYVPYIDDLAKEMAEGE